MDMAPYIDRLRHELAVVAEASGQEARELAERLTAPLESAIRLTLLDALSAAADEITRELAPGSVDLRLRRGEADFVVTPPVDRLLEEEVERVPLPEPEAGRAAAFEGKDGAVSRINLRLPEQLKARVEQASGREGLSVNAWLVRVLAEAVERTDRDPYAGRRAAPRGQRYTGWVR